MVFTVSPKYFWERNDCFLGGSVLLYRWSKFSCDGFLLGLFTAEQELF